MTPAAFLHLKIVPAQAHALVERRIATDSRNIARFMISPFDDRLTG
jgi:hypothetical protein